MSNSIHLLGPTASGKHSLAMTIAARLDAEIISIDSMKIYRGMDIGTAKPSRDALRRVHHHLIDILDPSESYSAARFAADARQAEDSVRRNGKVPLYVGGTALYYKALTRGLFPGPEADSELREELERIAAAKGVAHLHAELSSVDPVAAGRIHVNDLKRIVRALEVYRKTSRPISALQTQFDKPVENVVAVALWRGRDDLRERISARVGRMMKAGLVGEVERLRKREEGWSRQARSAVGYKEVDLHLAGRIDAAEAERSITVNTWHLARRQMMWFKGFAEVRRLDVAPGDRIEDIADRMVSILASV